MDLKDIVVVLDEGNAGAGRLELAINVACEQGACLSAVFVQNERRTTPFRGVTRSRSGFGTELSDASGVSSGAVLAADAEDEFRERLRAARIEGDWYSMDRADAGDLTTIAQAADLAIVGQVQPDMRPSSTWRPEDIVIACGRPVLMVPYIGSYPRVGRRVLVAWDGSREAARALNDALPLIRAAEAVTVMTVRARAKDLDPADQSMERIVRHLARHGIAAQPAEALHLSTATSDVLLSRSVDLAADLMIAGAYHHSQLREALLGGVSRELFQHMTLPVLMSH